MCVKAKRQANGKCIFDIRDQYRGLVIDLIIRQAEIRRRLIEEGIITTKEQVRAHIEKEEAQWNRLYEIARQMVFKLYPGNFQL
jgi:hypothetical protein